MMIAVVILFVVMFLGALLATKAKTGPQSSMGGAIFIVGFILLLMVTSLRAFAQHRAEDMALHHKFYSSWFMPDNRNISCCHDQDCSPAASKFESGKWYAMRDGEWIKIPDSKVEKERDTPDGRSHLCGRRYFFSGEFTVFCFIAGVAG